MRTTLLALSILALACGRGGGASVTLAGSTSVQPFAEKCRSRCRGAARPPACNPR